MKISDYRESIALQKSGAPISVGAGTFFIRRFATPESNQVLKDLRIGLFGPLHRAQDGDEHLVLAHWLADYGCTGWEGVIGEDDQALTYSKQAARAIFTNPEYFLSLNKILVDAACYFENYLHEEATKDIEVLKKK